MQFVGETLRKMPATLALVVVNCVVFGWLYLNANATDGPEWWLTLLDNGALYGPFVLDQQWSRIITSMFLHGHLLHLVFNMYGLFVIGLDVESHVGTKRFLLIYFLGGIAGTLCSLYFNLFLVGVGASGAVFALFGYALVIDIRRSQQDGHSFAPLIINFVVFLAINIVLAKPLHADTAAHLGGAAYGLLLGVLSIPFKKSLIPHIAAAVVLIVTFFSLSRFQVHYFKFFQEVLMAQDSTHYVLNNSDAKSNEEFLKDYRRVNTRWDTAMSMLNAISYTPEEVAADTFRLRRLIRYQKAQGDYRIIMIANESYIYADSIGVASDSIRKYTALDYVLNLKYTPPDSTEEKPGPPLEMAKIWYDSNWVEIPYPPAEYFRIGQRDTVGLWQGQLVDYFKNGQPQMKGSYKDDMKDGIFIYYTENGRYSAAGVYNEDQRVGKWETFHPNGKIESEVYYRERYFLKSYWDSTGTKLVHDGNGREIHRYSNGVIAVEGDYVDGYQEGYWYGRHSNGEMYFEENYNRGRLINGRSKSKSGRVAVYDGTTLIALPEGGFKKFNDYIRSKITPQGLGTVKLSFRVTVEGQITDFKIEQSVSKELDMKARQVVLTGPRWLPARLHGLEPTDGFGFVAIEF